jgi:spermidine/putrescine transport system substrate-binding protein
MYLPSDSPILRWLGAMQSGWPVAVLTILVFGLLAACGSPSPKPTPQPLAEELVLYNWAEDIPQSVLDDFTAEYGVQVRYHTYDSMEEAEGNIQAGKPYDVAVIENDVLPSLVADELLAEIDYPNVPNFKNISANFRDLAYDPGNQHSIPYSWGTTGILVRSDLVEHPVTQWADLWKTGYPGKLAVRDEPFELIGVALKSLGYSINSEDPAELLAAQERLMAVKSSTMFVDGDAEGAVAALLSGEAVLLVGYPGDALYASNQDPAIVYVLPQEGTFLWADNFVISSKSSRKYTAELFVNFLLRPEISARIVNEGYYATANEAAYPFIEPDILNNPIIFPSQEAIEKGEWYLPHSSAGQALYYRVWEQFMSAAP